LRPFPSVALAPVLPVACLRLLAAGVVQKYRLYLKRLAGLPPNARLSPELVPGSGHLYPYVHQPHEVPPAIIMPPQPVHQVPTAPLPHKPPECFCYSVGVLAQSCGPFCGP
jgi:hypothetical protein